MVVLWQAATVLTGLVVVSTLGACSATPVPLVDAGRCNDPARERLEELWTTHGTWHESIFQLLSTRNLDTSLQDINLSYVDVKEHSLETSACPFGEGSAKELKKYRLDQKGQVTLCPSHDVINYDENRIPAILFEKKCSCEKCALQPRRTKGVKGKNAVAGSHSDATSILGCVPVYYYAKVLRRVNCSDNVFIYRPVLEPLVFACKCDQQSRLTTATRGDRGHTLTNSDHGPSEGDSGERQQIRVHEMPDGFTRKPNGPRHRTTSRPRMHELPQRK